MKRKIRHLPPTAVPVAGGDIWRGMAGMLDPVGSLDRFRSALAEMLGNPNCFFTSSGRSALALILMSLRRLSGSKGVVIPAYSCPTVVQAVLQAGLLPVFCDVSPATLDLDRSALAELLDRDLLAILPTHLYGLAQDISDLVDLGRKRGVFIIEDAAQAFGAKHNGQMVGTAGQAGFFSLGRGKCLPVGHGGVIVVEDEFVPYISQTIRELSSEPVKRGLSSVAGFLAYGLATTPFGWWFIFRSSLNPARNGMHIDRLPPFHIGGLTAAQAAIGSALLERLNSVHSTRQQNARYLIEILSTYDFITLLRLPKESQPVFLRLPILLDSQKRADLLYQRLSNAGIGVSRSYTRTLPELFPVIARSDKQKFPGAEKLANNLLTLPTHHFLQEEDLVRINNVLNSIENQSMEE